MTSLQHIASVAADWPLFDGAASRRIEALAASDLPPHSLMQRAGAAVARLALALAPHAQRVWIAAGPGNNGGDGFEAAMHLHRAGKQVHVSAIGDAKRRPADAAASLARAQAAGVKVDLDLADVARTDLVIDGLLGLGNTRPATGAIADAVRQVNSQTAPRIAIDLPTGLDADTGSTLGDAAVLATHTVALLTLKPGLFTAHGRDLSGDVWFDDLGCGDSTASVTPRAWLHRGDMARLLRPHRRHAQHKGSFGDVIVVGGARGMVGAALLAGRAALAAGAGRVYVSALDPTAPGHDALWPELMLRPGLWRESLPLLAAATVVCGCGGGDAVREALPTLLARVPRLVLDADALNAIAADVTLRALLAARAGRDQATVLTPHPLEAARLAGAGSAAQIQCDRLGQAEHLAAHFGCIVLLKGSGTVIAAPGKATVINGSGSARLASAGTGDVLAGWLAGLWAATQAHAEPVLAHQVAAAAAWLHGAAADSGDSRTPLPASSLLRRLAEPD